jgi:hypothetical protein
MAIEKVIEIKLSAQEAEKNLKAINKTLEEQREILILLEKELLDVQDAQNKTSKTNLAAQKQLTTQSNHLKSSIRDQKLGLKSLNIERREAADVLADLNKGSKDNTNIIRGVDKLTGGYATKIIKLKKGFLSSIKVVKGFVAGLSGVKKALIATGIGALVVGLGLVVAYWEDIIALFDDGSKKLQEQADEHRKNISLSEDQLALLNNQEKILKLQGKSTKEVVEQKKKVLVLQQEENRLLLENLKTQLLREQQQQTELTFWEKTKVAVANAVGGLGAAAVANAKTFKKTAEEIEKLDDLEKQIQDTKINGQKLTLSLLQLDEKQKQKKVKDAKDTKQLEKEKQEALERIRKGEIDTEDERRAEELYQVQEQYKKLIKEADKYNQSTTELIEAQGVKEQKLKDKFAQQDKEKKLKEQEKLIEELELKKEDEELSFDEQRQLIADREQLLIEDKTLTDEQRLQLEGQFTDAKIKLAEAEAAAKDKTLGETADVLQKFSGIAGEETAAGKALGIASATINTYRGVSDALAATTVTPFETALKFANAGAILASGLQNVQKIVSVKVPRTSSGGGAAATGGSAPAPPSFNVVGASETSVLADTVAEQTNEPVQAYVVSNDVTTAQSLENNIVEGATL